MRTSRTSTPSTTMPSSALSSSHLRQTYLQQFRLVSPENSGHLPTAESTALRGRPPLLEPSVLHGNAAAQARAKKQAEMDRMKAQRRREYERQQEQMREMQQPTMQQQRHPPVAYQTYNTQPYTFHQPPPPTFAHTQPLGPYGYYAAPSSSYSPSPRSALPYDYQSRGHAGSSHDSRPYTSPAGMVASHAQGTRTPKGTTQHFPPPEEKESSEQASGSSTLPSIQQRSQQPQLAEIGSSSTLGSVRTGTADLSTLQRPTSASSREVNAGESNSDKEPAIPSMVRPSDEYLIRRGGSMPVNPTFPTDVSPTAAAASTPMQAKNSARSYTLRKAAGAGVLQDLSFPPPKPSPRSSAAAAVVARSKVLSGSEEKDSISLNGPPANGRIVSTKDLSGKTLHLLGSLLTPSKHVLIPDAKQKTMFDEDMDSDIDEEEEGDGVGEGSDEAALYQQRPPSSQFYHQGFQPQVEDVMDLYFFLTDPACPIFRQQGSVSGMQKVSGLASETRAALQGSTGGGGGSSSMHSPLSKRGAGVGWNGTSYTTGNASNSNNSTYGAWSRTSMTNRDDEDDADDLPKSPRFQSSLVLSALSERVGMDLPRLAALREAAGGGVNNALGYLAQLCPTSTPSGGGGVSLLTSTGPSISSSSSRATSTLAHFDPFTSMDELIHTVRSMHERDVLAGIPPPVWKKKMARQNGPATTRIHNDPNRPIHIPPQQSVPAPARYFVSHRHQPELPTTWRHDPSHDMDEAQEARLCARDLLGYSSEKKSSAPVRSHAGEL